MDEHSDNTHPAGGPNFEIDESYLADRICTTVSYGMSEISGGLPTHTAILSALSTTILPKGSHVWDATEDKRGVDVVALRQTIPNVERMEVLTERGDWLTISDRWNLRVSK